MAKPRADKLLFTITFALATLVLAGLSYYSPLWRKQVFAVAAADSFAVNDSLLIAGSLQVWADTLLATEGWEFSHGYLKLKQAVSSPFIEVEYQVYTPVKPTFYFKEQNLADTTGFKPPIRRLWGQGGTGKLDVNGSKTVAVSVGSDKDLAVEQSLFLQIDGQISKNMFIQAQLSDSQSPITPEGDSRELSSLDQVFIKLYGKGYELAFGDLDLEFSGTEFFNWHPRFEGVKASYQNFGQWQGALAVTRGKPFTIDIAGSEGVQGPYYIKQLNGESTQLVVAGSEQVWLNGVLMQRGDDYSISYAEGTITFAVGKPIDKNSNIRVTCLVSDENYRQNMYLGSAEAEVYPGFKVSTAIAYQQDDKGNPLQYSFTDADKQALKAAGDAAAWGQGIFEVEPGIGNYIKKQEGAEVWYQYVGPEAEGNYTLYFTYVGSGLGDYEQSGFDSYTYQGVGGGSWVIGRRLPAATALLNADTRLSYTSSQFTIWAEALVSDRDENLFSDIDDDDNTALASHIQAEFTPNWDKLNPGLSLWWRTQSANLNTFAQIEAADQAYDNAGFSKPDSTAGQEIGANLRIAPTGFSQSFAFNQKSWQNKQNSLYLLSVSQLKQQLWLPQLDLRLQYQKQNTKGQDLQAETGFYEQSKAGYTIGPFSAAVTHYWKSFEQELSTGKLGQRLQKSGAQTGWAKPTWAISVQGEKETNQSLDEAWQVTDKAWSATTNAWVNTQHHNLDLQYTHRQTEAKKGSKEKYDLATLNQNHDFLNGSIRLSHNYSLKNLLYYPSERRLIWVGEEEGLYDSTGVYDETGEYDYDLVTLDDPEMSLEVTTGGQVNASGRLLPAGLRTAFLERLESESQLTVSNSSTSSEQLKVYLFYPSMLFNRQSSIYSRLDWQQTLYYELLPRKAQLRLRYQRTRSLDNRWSDADNITTSQSQAALQLNRLGRHDLELEVSRETETQSRYDSATIAWQTTAELRTTFGNDLILTNTASAATEQGTNASGSSDYDLTWLQGESKVSWFWQKALRVTAGLSVRNTQKSGSYLNSLQEKRPGTTIKSTVNASYQLNSYTSSQLVYSLSSYPKQDALHTLRLEVRAEF